VTSALKKKEAGGFPKIEFRKASAEDLCSSKIGHRYAGFGLAVVQEGEGDGFSLHHEAVQGIWSAEKNKWVV
jgi:hypothetical protein